MTNKFLLSILVLFLAACNNSEKIPDVSGIKIELTTERFERDLFNLDTTGFTEKLDQLQAKYPSFGENFISSILGADPRWKADSIAAYVKSFVRSFRNVYDSTQVMFKDFTPYENDIRKGLQFVNFYFPDFKIPKKIITYIGPLDGFGDILAEDAIIVGLHHHLGRNYSLYKTDLVQETYPEYLTNRFEPEYIAINSIRNIILDMYPEKAEDKTLIQQMVENGKRLYALSRLMPFTETYKLMGYTKLQYTDCLAHEKAIWNLFVQNNFLQTIDNNIIKNYIGEGPKTQELGEASPGNIGSFAGWQIVKKYMEKNPKLPLKQLMSTDPETVFSEARYKP